jgi:hypothetical protein
MTQIICEAKESKVAPATLDLYCIDHDEVVRVGYEDDGAIYHTAQTGDGDYSYCFFKLGYTFCPPPADDGDWASQEPSLEEREQAEIEEQGMWLGGGE